MKILITGATGVVGRRLVPILDAAGHELTAVARSSSARAGLEAHGAATVDLDLFDLSAVRRAVAGHDTLINLATHIPHPAWRMFLPSSWRENDRLRREASAILVNACLAAGVSRFIQESFAPVYPDRGDEWIDETTPISPVRYNLTVADAESSADRFARNGNAGIVLRFGAFYGADAYQTIEMIKSVRSGWAPMPGPENAFVSSISHDDAASAVAAALTLPSGVYNVVDDDPVTHRDFFGSLAEALGVDPPRFPPTMATFLFGSLGEMLSRSLRISNRKLRASSSWTPQYKNVRAGWRAVVGQIGAQDTQARAVHATQRRV